MASSRPIEPRAAIQPGEFRPTLARSIAPEDIRPGDDLAILDEMYELPSYWWCDDSVVHPRDELVRVRLLPTHENLPLRVKSVCLPFVLTKQPGGESRTLDLRRLRVARLDRRYAAAVRKAYKKKKPRVTP